MHINNIYIEKLWGTKNLNWHLNSDVVILSGINGSGKSTVLRAIAALLQGKPLLPPYHERLQKVVIDMSDSLELSLEISKNSSSDSARPNAPTLFEDDSIRVVAKEEEKDNIETLVVSKQHLAARKDSKNLKAKEVFPVKQANFISTFDSIPPEEKDPAKLLAYLVSASVSELDRFLEKTVDRYKNYQLELSNRMVNQMSDKGFDSSSVKELFRSKNSFMDKIDSLFAESGKFINRTKGELEFVFKSDNESHPYSQLSAGEKQVLLILLTVFMQGGKEAILIMDEPEISLHIDWQKRLLADIKDLNPKCQVIVSTHSPSMIMDGWHNAVINMDEITSPA
ncbi:MAG: ATP-binding protein [Muribaculaceae bacterium]|nr:ATP-binding protein [Muribaculaceae bacterium]